MQLSKYDKAALVLIVLLFGISAYLYPSLPEQIPTHWNVTGQIDDYSSKEMVFLFPVIIALVYGLFLILPKIAVFKDNIKGFKHFESMKLVLILFFMILFGTTLLPNLGYVFNMSYVLLPLIGLLFIYFGYILPAAKRNFFIGIRTPWTLASDLVWKETHSLGGKLFIIVGILFMLLVFVDPKYLVWLILAKVLGVVVFLCVYSYWLWSKTGRNKKL